MTMVACQRFILDYAIVPMYCGSTWLKPYRLKHLIKAAATLHSFLFSTQIHLYQKWNQQSNKPVWKHEMTNFISICKMHWQETDAWSKEQFQIYLFAHQHLMTIIKCMHSIFFENHACKTTNETNTSGWRLKQAVVQSRFFTNSHRATKKGREAKQRFSF